MQAENLDFSHKRFGAPHHKIPPRQFNIVAGKYGIIGAINVSVDIRKAPRLEPIVFCQNHQP